MPGNAAGCVTVSNNARTTEIQRARDVAARVGLPFVKNVDSSLPRLVVERAGVHLDTTLGTIRSHPGMGLVRVRRLVRGEEHDPLVDLAELREGDHVVDATFGFGQDALVMAWAVGEQGRITALEASPILAGLALAGMSSWSTPGDLISKRIELVHTDARTWLKAAETASADVVLIDPMFRKPKSAAPDFAVLRHFAEEAPLDVETLNEARRVARRWVLVKDAWPGHELVRLGREPEDRMRRADIVFGRWPPLNEGSKR